MEGTGLRIRRAGVACDRLHLPDRLLQGSGGCAGPVGTDNAGRPPIDCRASFRQYRRRSG